MASTGVVLAYDCMPRVRA